MTPNYYQTVSNDNTLHSETHPSVPSFAESPANSLRKTNYIMVGIEKSVTVFNTCQFQTPNEIQISHWTVQLYQIEAFILITTEIQIHFMKSLSIENLPWIRILMWNILKQTFQMFFFEIKIKFKCSLYSFCFIVKWTLWSCFLIVRVCFNIKPKETIPSKR